MHFCNFIYCIKCAQKEHERIKELCQNQQKIKLTKDELEETRNMYNFFKKTFLDETNFVSNGPFDLYVKSLGENVSVIELRFLVRIKKYFYNNK